MGLSFCIYILTPESLISLRKISWPGERYLTATVLSCVCVWYKIKRWPCHSCNYEQWWGLCPHALNFVGANAPLPGSTTYAIPMHNHLKLYMGCRVSHPYSATTIIGHSYTETEPCRYPVMPRGVHRIQRLENEARASIPVCARA